MDINELNFFKAIGTKLNWLEERQKILAANVANADTPNYRAQDLEPITFQDALDKSQGGQGSLQMRKTAAGHLGTGPSTSNKASFEVPIAGKDGDFENSPHGNNVILEQEMIKVTDTAANYNLMLRLYKKGADMMKMAVRPPK